MWPAPGGQTARGFLAIQCPAGKCLNPIRCLPVALAGLALMFCALVAPAIAEPVIDPTPDADATSAVQALAAAGFLAKPALLQQIAGSGEPWARAVLQGLLDGTLQFHKADQRVVLALPAGQGFELVDPVSGASLGAGERLDLKRIPINNTLRTQLNGLIARLSLADPDPRRRRAAVRSLYETLDVDSADLLRERRSVEPDGGVRDAIDVALALADLASGQPGARSAAARQLAGSVEPSVRVRLGAVADDATQPQDVRDEARRALARSEASVGLYRSAEMAFSACRSAPCCCSRRLVLPSPSASWA